jgi:hypothetical protein
MKGSDASRSSSANHAATSVTTGSRSTPRPARRTLTRSPSNLNSRGRRTAWLRPFLNSFAVAVTIASSGLYQQYRPVQCSGSIRIGRAKKALRAELADWHLSDLEADRRQGCEIGRAQRDARHGATGGTPLEPRNSNSGRLDSNRRPPAPKPETTRFPAIFCTLRFPSLACRVVGSTRR